MSAHVEHHVIRDHDMRLRHRFYTENSLGTPRRQAYQPRPRTSRRQWRADRKLREHLAVLTAVAILALVWWAASIG